MEIVVLLVIAALFWFLFIKGHAWPILMVCFTTYGGKLLIMRWFPSSAATILTFMGYTVSYAAFIAALVAILAAGYFMKED